jgi:hypothetical protein
MVGESVRVSEDDGKRTVAGCVETLEILLDDFFVYRTTSTSDTRSILEVGSTDLVV